MCPFSAVKIIWNIPSWQNDNAFYRELFATERCPLRKVWNLIYLLNIVYIHLIYLISRIVNSFTQYRVWSHHLCKRSHTRLFISRRIFFLCLLLPFLHNNFVNSTLFQFCGLIYITLTIEQFQPHTNPEGGWTYLLWKDK